MAQDLTARTLAGFHIAHVLRTGPEQLVCLDFHFAAKTREELQTRLLERLASMKHDQILPYAPKPLWDRFEKIPQPKPEDDESFRILTDLVGSGLIRVMIHG